MLLESRRNWCTQWNGWNGCIGWARIPAITIEQGEQRCQMNICPTACLLLCGSAWAEGRALPCWGTGGRLISELRERTLACAQVQCANVCSTHMCSRTLPHLFPSLEGAQVQQGDREREKKTKQKTRSADWTDVTNACCLRASEFSVSPLAQTWRTIRGREEKKQMRILGERKVRFWDATAAGPAAAQPGPISRTSKYGAQLSIQRQTEQTISCTRRPSESCAP